MFRRRPKGQPEPVRNELIEEIQAVLPQNPTDDSLVLPGYRGGSGLNGYCYAAAEAYFHLAGGRDAGLQPRQSGQGGLSHWWLAFKDDPSHVVDLTVERPEKARHNYKAGHNKGFMYESRGPSKRAQEIIRRVEKGRG